MDAAEYALMDIAEDRMWWYRALHARLLDALSETSGQVLDAGCGTGGFLAVLRERRPDLARVGLEWAECAALRAEVKGEAPVIRGSVNRMPFVDKSFDAVVLADVLCHVGVDPVAALTECHRVLRPGGKLVMNMPAYAWLMSTHDKHVRNARRTTATETAHLLGDVGFSSKHVGYWNSLLLPIMIARRVLLTRNSSTSDVSILPPWQDTMLYGITRIERSLPFTLPAGGSVLAIAERD